MQYEFEIYTSAEELLQPGTSNLGVVAQTRGFPAELSRSLANLRYYSFLEQLPLQTPEVHPPRLIIGPVGSADYYSIVYSAFNGPDFTGRTTPTVQVATAKINELKEFGVAATDLISAAGPELRTPWHGRPRWLEAKQTQPHSNANTNCSYTSKSWGSSVTEPDHNRLLSYLASAVLNYELRRQPTILALNEDQAQNALHIFQDILSLLPASIQLKTVCASHIIENSDFLNGTSIGITYNRTPFFRDAAARHDPQKPILVDPNVPGTFFFGEENTYAQFVLSYLTNNNQAAISDRLRDWDLLGFTNETLQSFAKFANLTEKIAVAKSVEDIDTIDCLLKSRTFSAQQERRILAKSLSAVKRIATGNEKSKADLLHSMLLSTNWPQESREAVATHMAEAFKWYLPLIFKGNASPPDPVLDLLKHPLSQNAEQNVISITEFCREERNTAPLELLEDLLKCEDITIIGLLKLLAEEKRNNVDIDQISEILKTSLARKIKSASKRTEFAQTLQRGLTNIEMSILETIAHDVLNPEKDELYRAVKQIRATSTNPEKLDKLLAVLDVQPQYTAQLSSQRGVHVRPHGTEYQLQDVPENEKPVRIIDTFGVRMNLRRNIGPPTRNLPARLIRKFTWPFGITSRLLRIVLDVAPFISAAASFSVLFWNLNINSGLHTTSVICYLVAMAAMASLPLIGFFLERWLNIRPEKIGIEVFLYKNLAVMLLFSIAAISVCGCIWPNLVVIPFPKLMGQ